MNPLTVAELDGIEQDLDKMGTPPDNVLRRLVAEVRQHRGLAAPKREPKIRRAKPKGCPIQHHANDCDCDGRAGDR